MTQLPWYIQHWIGLKDTTTFVVAVAGASIALLTYARNARTKRAEFLTSLHKSFFIDQTYQDIREVLDDDTEHGEAKRDQLVQMQGIAFINFLNFFELIAYFERLGAYKRKDVLALLGYYLRLMKRSGSVYRYICDRRNDFEHLKTLLARLDP